MFKILINNYTIIFCLLVGMLNSCKKEFKPNFSLPIGKMQTLTEDGAWCWFSDPRAIYVHGNRNGIQTGWVTENGTIEAGFIGENGEIKKQILADTLDKDDHANPAFVQLLNGETMVFYTKHFDEKIRSHKMKNNSKDSLFGKLIGINPFDSFELKKFPLKRTTYANPFVLEDEAGKLFCFGRWTGFKPNMMWSTDHGKTFSKSKVVVTNYPFDGENRPYVKYYSDGKSKIHMVFTDGHPRNEPLNSVYYAYYEKEAFWRVDGSKICNVDELPFEPKDASIVYKADERKGRSWIYDLASDEKGNPVILYARYPNEETHIYHYAKYTGDNWLDVKICNSGKWFEKTPENKVEPEPHYSGGMTLNPLKTNVVFTSETINKVFEIVRYKFNTQGEVEKRELITSNSKRDNIRPFIPRNMKKEDPEVVLWMENEKYVHYTNYKTAIKYYSYK
ncbi:BNR-4 repeat-containing protein [Mariniflexile sp. AS56]|uniref:BNR-4 repeat-containing protein n=1 Tax=Mariniflexile sp. AS56 TaxID=3063957 RepID=UPI0026F1268B|nr:BNR-4 repeat-containing protein [Mariniflexile sp. AS56]MDO7172538.1 BNR-4 repeat-containing protein [Mariniflexile sp. AS56]